MRWMFLLLPLAACVGDETLSGYGANGQIWTLVEMDGRAPDHPATIVFERNGHFSGRGPCNSYSGQSNVPYPWFRAGPIAATRKSCPHLDEEQAYLGTLARMTLAEFSGNRLLLSNDDGDILEFTLQLDR